MSKTAFSLTLVAALVLAHSFTRSANAQVREDASRLYGQGVHAYFAGNYSQAEIHLSSALELNADDPRYYYFRALALLRRGRGEEARGDMLLAAQLEAQHPGRFAIGTALERVQGADRLMLERFRREARATTGITGADAKPPRLRSQPMNDRDDDALRRKLIIPLDQFLQPGGPQPIVDSATPLAPPQPTFAPLLKPAAPPVAQDDPFRDDPHAQPSVEQPPKPAAPPLPPQAPEQQSSSPPARTEDPAVVTPPPSTPPAADANPFDF